MRRKDREVTDPEEIRQVLDACSVLHLGLNDGGRVYIVPLNFGYLYEDGKYTLYFHGAREGRKVDVIRENPAATFEMECGYELVKNDLACDHSSKYRCVMGEGKVRILEDPEEKRFALNRVMLHNTGKGDWHFPELMLKATYAFRIEVESISCKIHR